MEIKNKYNSFWLSLNFLLTNIYIAWAIVPYFYRNTPKIIVPILLIFWVISALFSLGAKVKVNLISILILMWSLLLTMYYLFNINITASGNLYSSILYYFPMFVFIHYYKVGKDKYLKRILLLTILLAAINSISNITILSQDPYASKYLTGDIYGTMISKYGKTNLASISFVNPVAILVPIMIGIEKTIKNRKYKVLLITIIFISTIFVISASSFITTIVLFIEFFMILLWTKHKELNFMNVIFILCLFLLIMFFRKDIGHLLISISVKIDNLQYGLRLEELGNFFLRQSNNGSLTSRLKYINLSFNTFLKNPIFGVGMIYNINYLDTGVGMHSQIIDDLARYGLFGLFFNISIYYSFFKQIFKNVTNTITKKILIISIIGSILLSFLNISIEPSFSIMIFFIVPIYALSYKSESL